MNWIFLSIFQWQIISKSLAKKISHFYQWNFEIGRNIQFCVIMIWITWIIIFHYSQEVLLKILLIRTTVNTVSASINRRRSIKKSRFYGEILLNKMLSNWQILLNKVLTWRFNQEWPLICADTVLNFVVETTNFFHENTHFSKILNVILTLPFSFTMKTACNVSNDIWYTS